MVHLHVRQPRNSHASLPFTKYLTVLTCPLAHLEHPLLLVPPHHSLPLRGLPVPGCHGVVEGDVVLHEALARLVLQNVPPRELYLLQLPPLAPLLHEGGAGGEEAEDPVAVSQHHRIVHYNGLVGAYIPSGRACNGHAYDA